MTLAFLDHSGAWIEVGLECTLAVGAGMALHVVLYRLLLRESAGRVFAPALIDALGRCPAPCLPPLVLLSAVLGHAPESLPAIGPLRHAVAIILVTVLAAIGLQLVRGLNRAVGDLFPPEIAEALDGRRVCVELRRLSRWSMTLIVMTGVAVILMTFPGVRFIGGILLALSGGIWMVAGIAAMPTLDDLAARVELALLARTLGVPDAPPPPDAAAPRHVKSPRHGHHRLGRRYCRP